MKKILLIVAILLLISSNGYAAQNSDSIAALNQHSFFKNIQQYSFLTPCEQVKRLMYTHLKYANSYDLKGLSNLYAENYTNADGLSKDLYIDLIKKTWSSYPNIKYKIAIKNITLDGDNAVVQIDETAEATTDSKSGIVNEKGLLQSISSSVYYLEKNNDEWLITSDHILFEKTFLRYGSAKNIMVELNSPCQISANTQYTASLKLGMPKDSLIIASIGQENITYPQTVTEEVFRKLPEDGLLERVFKSNDKNINEYSVASYGITKAEITNGKEIKIYVTGLGFVMSRVNVIPKNNFIKVAKNEKNE